MIYSFSSNAHAEECKDVLIGLQDIYKNVNSNQLNDYAKRIICNRSNSARNGSNNGGFTIPFEGIPIQLGFSDKSKRVTQKEFCSLSDVKVDRKHLTEVFKKTANVNIINAWSKCNETKFNKRLEFGCNNIKLRDQKSIEFRIVWDPEIEVKTPRIKKVTYKNMHKCVGAYGVGSKMIRGAKGTEFICDRINKNKVAVMNIATDTQGSKNCAFEPLIIKKNTLSDQRKKILRFKAVEVFRFCPATITFPLQRQLQFPISA
jgi:hypothetical protein